MSSIGIVVACESTYSYPTKTFKSRDILRAKLKNFSENSRQADVLRTDRSGLADSACMDS